MATRHSYNSLLDEEDSSEMVALSSGEMAKQSNLRTGKKGRHKGLSINPVPSVVEYTVPDVRSGVCVHLCMCVALLQCVVCM